MRPSQLQFRSVLLARRGKVHDIVGRLVAGDIGVEEFGDDFYRELLDGHAESWGLGRHRAGDLVEDGDDYYQGRRVADTETELLQGFLEDLRGDRYRDEESGNLRGDAIKCRSDLYVQKMRATAGQAFIDTSSDLAEFTWVLGAGDEHCTDCPQLADMSPWTRDTLFSIPAGGDTPCLGHCKCYLVRSDGITSFKSVEFDLG